ncbi:K+/H+ antiporter subunit F [Tabrizicola sp. TH137]|uniref:K+/H+ antiporter subunit F n=1 Tax=Tabrizicola sp. TH137 TaxID=2067452 RepID=UPI000C7E72E4|nr:K+/H+ antiporter subunit F [Tabrizicola sp. TH137]PLL10891.1 K+/H+ antiporter subunit F [Tabrizicola sp. TH137]
MITYALAFALVCFGLGLILNLWRLVIGPTVADRVLALDTMVVNVIAIIVLYGIQTGLGINFEAAMLFAMTGFVGTVAFCKYLLRGSVIE